jgi:hypothetical protein
MQHQQLTKAMKKAVELGIFPKVGNLDQYTKHWQDLEQVLKAGQAELDDSGKEISPIETLKLNFDTLKFRNAFTTWILNAGGDQSFFQICDDRHIAPAGKVAHMTWEDANTEINFVFVENEDSQRIYKRRLYL